MNTQLRLLNSTCTTSSCQLVSTLVLVAFVVFSGCSDKTDTAGAMSLDDASSTAMAANTLSKADVDAGWKLLFDGKTTAGWKGYNRDTFPTKGWHVTDGMMVVEASKTEEAGFGGDIVTTDSFDNFDFSVDFMLTDTANSGILYRVVENEDPIWYNAPEFQLLDDETYISRDGLDNSLLHLTGDNYDMQSSSVKASNPIGEWNTARVVVDGPHVEHWLNGQKTLEYELWSPKWEAMVMQSKFAEYPAYGRTQRGPIGLQDHGHRVSFRNIKIRSL